MTLRQSNYLQYAPKYGKEENFWSSLTGWALNLKTVIISLGFFKNGQDFRFWHRIRKNPLSARNGMLCWHLILKQSFYAIVVNFRPSKQSNNREADTPILALREINHPINMYFHVKRTLSDFIDIHVYVLQLLRLLIMMSTISTASHLWSLPGWPMAWVVISLFLNDLCVVVLNHSNTCWFFRRDTEDT